MEHDVMYTLYKTFRISKKTDFLTQKQILLNLK
jgi:hypothetical protein